MRYRRAGQLRFALFSIDDVKRGVYTALCDVAQPAGLKELQGYAVYGSFLYLLCGQAHDPDTQIVCVDLNSGAKVADVVTHAASSLTFREPEGMAVQLTNAADPASARLCMGFADGVSGARNASIYYKNPAFV